MDYYSPHIEQLVLSKIRLAISAEIAEPESLTSEAIADFDVRAEYVARHHAYRLTAIRYVLGVGGVDHSYPADWWQAFKERFAPAWALKRWPVEQRTFRTWERVCPHHSSPHSGKKHIEWLAGYSAEEMF